MAKTFKLALSAGHYLKNPRRCIAPLDPNETREWTLNARICEKIEAIFAEYDGIEVLRVDDRTGAKDISLSARATAANNWYADMYGAVHANAAKNDGKPHNASGIVVYVKEDASPETCGWQDAFYNALVAATGLKGNRANPKPKRNLYEAYLPNMVSLVFELGFMDSPTDVPIILTEDFADKVAKAFCEVIIEKVGLKKKTDKVEAEYIPAVGDTVVLSKNAVVYGTTKKFSSWVYRTQLYVRKVEGAKITVSIFKVGAITGRVDKKYLSKLN